jgi:para-aminobenzoate synthetase
MEKSAVNHIHNNEHIKMITEAIQGLSKISSRPIVVAIDGASGSGKSTIAQFLCRQLPAVIVPLDDFFSADIPDDQWNKFSVQERLENVFDWNRVRAVALEPLRNNVPAQWHPFDFLAGIQQDGTYPLKKEETILNPAKIIMIEGSYSSCSFLADLIDLTILIDVPVKERHHRLFIREDPTFLAQWHQRWDAVEIYYFEQIKPKMFFDWIIENSIV